MERLRNIAAVAHNWANRIGESGTASNLYFNGESIYSYGQHFMVARHVRNATDGEAVLVTARTYSRSTSRHITLVRQASRHYQQIGVPDPEFDAEMMFDAWLDRIKTISAKLATARRAEKLVLEIRQVYAAAERYARFFGIEVPAMLQQAGEIADSGQYREMLRKETTLRKVQEKKRRAAALRLHKADLKRWRAFETNRLSSPDGYDHLRFNKASGRIETSQQVEIPETVGRQFYAVILKTLADGGCTGCKLRLMEHYEVKDINEQFIRVGCHKISQKEIRSFIKKQGWQ